MRKKKSTWPDKVFRAWIDGCHDVASLSEHLHIRSEAVIRAIAEWNTKYTPEHTAFIDVKEKMTAEEWEQERQELLDKAAASLLEKDNNLSATELASCYSTVRTTITAAEIERRSKPKMKQIVTVHMTRDLERIKRCPKWAELISDSEVPVILSLMEQTRGLPVRVFLPPARVSAACPGSWSYEVVPDDGREIFGLVEGQTLYVCEHCLDID